MTGEGVDQYRAGASLRRDVGYQGRRLAGMLAPEALS